ncbi:MATE family efflux transporter [Iocasia frigidifontis]|uniref:Probable multidrug resistance protein NorM n=1 Tax=Iocasia fonsfrigidae TaxID=2682810 RepID=A0A8A7KG10_9FIRM|nr:MATE family efflux transporter [Iocasia fonsfrigidae]
MQSAKKSDRLGQEAIIPLLFRLAIPSIIAMFIQSMYNVVDSIYVGRYSKEALAALSLAYPVQLILIAIAVGTGVGTSTYISRQLGQGNKDNAENAAEHILHITAVYGIIVALFGYFFSDILMAWFTDDQQLITMGTEYIRIILIGAIALFIPMIGNNILRGEGNTFLPMITMLIGSVINIVLDPFLIFGIGFFPRMGVSGAALATVFSRVISGSFLLFILFSNKNELKINLRKMDFNLSIIKSIYIVGLPAMVMQLLASAMLIAINKFILAPHSDVAIAVGGIYIRLQSFVFMPVFGLNQGYMPIMGYNFGHKNPERMKKTMKAAFLIATAFTLLGFLIFQLFPKQLIMAFSEDTDLITMGTTALKRISLAFPIIGISIIISTTFQSLGSGLPSLLLSIIRQIIILLPVMYYLGQWFGFNKIWYAFPLSEFISLILGAGWLYFRLKKVFSYLRE